LGKVLVGGGRPGGGQKRKRKKVWVKCPGSENPSSDGGEFWERGSKSSLSKRGPAQDQEGGKLRKFKKFLKRRPKNRNKGGKRKENWREKVLRFHTGFGKGKNQENDSIIFPKGSRKTNSQPKRKRKKAEGSNPQGERSKGASLRKGHSRRKIFHEKGRRIIQEEKPHYPTKKSSEWSHAQKAKKLADRPPNHEKKHHCEKTVFESPRPKENFPPPDEKHPSVTELPQNLGKKLPQQPKPQKKPPPQLQRTAKNSVVHVNGKRKGGIGKHSLKTNR